MSWYAYQRGGWQIAVDAVSQRDASNYIKIYAPGAEYQGVLIPPTWENPSMATAMTTPKRQEQISNKVRID